MTQTHSEKSAGRDPVATRHLFLVGSVGCGKTSLLQRLRGLEQTYAKTQATYTYEGICDTPGELIDSPWLKPALRQASTNADLIVFLQAAIVSNCKIPPLFTTFFTKPVIGVITKIDLATPKQIDHARDLLKLTGVSEVYPVSSVTGEGFEELAPHLV